MKKEIVGQNEKYYRTKMKKDKIINELRSRGGRITKQRSILLDIKIVFMTLFKVFKSEGVVEGRKATNED